MVRPSEQDNTAPYTPGHTPGGSPGTGYRPPYEAGYTPGTVGWVLTAEHEYLQGLAERTLAEEASLRERAELMGKLAVEVLRHIVDEGRILAAVPSNGDGYGRLRADHARLESLLRELESCAPADQYGIVNHLHDVLVEHSVNAEAPLRRLGELGRTDRRRLQKVLSRAKLTANTHANPADPGHGVADLRLTEGMVDRLLALLRR